ncbi:hypothetical protein ACWDX8_15835 [Streptomyces anthocyanicus]
MKSTGPAWPVSGKPIGDPVSAFHWRIVRSAPAVAMREPPAAKAMARIAPW